MPRMEIGGAAVRLDPAAVSAIRYRVAYGRSIVTDLAECGTVREAEKKLLRMCHLMIPEGKRPELSEFARYAGRDSEFLQKAFRARDALLHVDEAMRPHGADEGGEPFDEYGILALMIAAHMDLRIIYELPIMHIVGIMGQSFALQDPDRKTYRPMTREEQEQLYPRRKRSA